MKLETDRKPVITLSNESFKHYLLQRYGANSDESWRKLFHVSQELISPDTWIKLYNRAKADLESSGGCITGYEVVDDELVSHEAIGAYWPGNCMWVMQFEHEQSN
ncbi:hypothetical protein [Dyadobacter crusticola]|uniref:hypothetical protein n=1 Tax=Dyadobacter crusticola TaxID=292407 RepID=UPI0004E17D5D|nr:hypothetical protein [Dyadobacter crusticola]